MGSIVLQISTSELHCKQHSSSFKRFSPLIRAMEMKKMFCYMVVIFALIFASGNAKTLEKRSPEEGGEGIDHCTGAFGNFFAFMNWCETGEVGAKPVAAEEDVVE